MNITKPTIATMTSIVAYQEGECEEYQRKIASIKKELSKVETLYVGAKEELRKGREALAQADAAIPRNEVTLREVDIARMMNEVLVEGEPLKDDVWAKICNKTDLSQEVICLLNRFDG